MNNINFEVKKNTIYNIIKTVSSVIFPLLLFPYSARVLGPENLGRINFATSIVNYVSLIASLGVATYAVRECAKLQNDKAKLNEISSQIFSINLMSTVIAYILMIAAIVFNKKLQSEFVLIFILSIPVLFQALGADWINTAMGDLRYISLRTLLFQMLSLLAVFGLVNVSEDYIIFAIISAGASIGANLLNIFYRKKYCHIRPTKKINLKLHLKPILLLFVLTLSQTIFLNLDTTMIGFFRHNSEVGMYSVAVKIYNLTSTLISAITIVVLPQLSYWNGEKNIYEIRKMQRYALNYILTIGIPIVIGINILTPGIITIMAGENYLSTVPALRILSLALFFVMFGGAFIGNIVLLSSSKEKIFMKASVIATLINAILNFFFIPQYGMIAAAVTTVVSEFFILGFLYINGHKFINTGNCSKMIIKPVIGVVPFGFISFVLRQLISKPIPHVLCTIVLCAMAYFFIEILINNEFIAECKEIFKKAGKNL